MAIHKKLPVGSILFTFHQPQYNYYGHRNGRSKYTIQFNLLYVYNRRERSSGASVPSQLIPTLEKLGIRFTEAGRGRTTAIGCRHYTYFQCDSYLPYPTPDQVKEAAAALERIRNGNNVIYNSMTLVDNEFMKDFRNQKMSNKDTLFSLLKPLKEYSAEETYIKVS